RVDDRPEKPSRAGEPRRARFLDGAEIRQQHAVVIRYEHVRRLDVAMNEPVRVRDVEGVRDLSRNTQRAPQLELAVLPQGRSEIALGDVGHRDVEDALLL